MHIATAVFESQGPFDPSASKYNKKVELKSTFHNSGALCNISAGAKVVFCCKWMLEIHPEQGVSDVPCDFTKGLIHLPSDLNGS